MNWRGRWHRWKRQPGTRHILLGIALVLIAASPAVGVLPGPGGILLAAAGLALALQTSIRAKRLYVRIGRRWPRLRAWLDWGMRRRRRGAVAMAAAD